MAYAIALVIRPTEHVEFGYSIDSLINNPLVSCRAGIGGPDLLPILYLAAVEKVAAPDCITGIPCRGSWSDAEFTLRMIRDKAFGRNGP